MAGPKLLIITTVPPDLKAALMQRYEVVDRQAVAGWPDTAARGFDVAVTTSMAGIDDATMAALPDLKVVLCNGAGTDRLDLAAARRRKVVVFNTPDELAEDVADAAIALTYATMRRVVEADRFVRSGRWQKERMTPSRRVGSKTMGIVGLGKIGLRVAKRAEGIGMKVIYLGRRKRDGVSYPFTADILDLAEKCDVLVLSCPGGEATKHLVNRAVLESLGKTGYLINVSRGTVVDEPALIAALQSGMIAGAGLDVFASEPNLDPRFLTLESVVLQPHSTSITYETRVEMIDRLLGDLDAFLNGRSYTDAAAAHGAA